MNGRRPVVGVTCSARGGRFMWWCNRLALWRAGARAVRLVPGGTVARETLDALVLGGGDDIEATLYRDEIDPTVRMDDARDALERDLLHWAWDRGVPVLGICRGAQMINVALGGTLHEEVKEAFPFARHRRQVLPRKRVTVTSNSRLAGILASARCRVNALHHQAIDRLGDGLRVVARDENGVIQGIEAADGRRFAFGVQWHPEFLVFDRGQQRLFRALAGAARGVA